MKTRRYMMSVSAETL